MEKDNIGVRVRTGSNLLHTLANLSAQYHDDGEPGLGPTVATLSLGCPSTMTFRPQEKARVPEGDAWITSGGGNQWICPGVELRAKATAPVLEIPLLHGDMLVMAGEKIQQLYEASGVSIVTNIYVTNSQ